MSGLRGFTRANLFRMRQFYATYQGDEKVPPLVTQFSDAAIYATYRDDEKVAPPVRQLPWTHNLSFYLEALDRDVKKPHEHPSIGVLLCSTKDEEVVEYALNWTLSPALIAEYQTQLPDKQLLKAKLQEFYLQCEAAAEGDE